MKIILEEQEIWTLQTINRNPVDIEKVPHKALQHYVDFARAGIIESKIYRIPSDQYSLHYVKHICKWTITDLGKEVLKQHLPIANNKQMLDKRMGPVDYQMLISLGKDQEENPVTYD